MVLAIPAQAQVPIAESPVVQQRAVDYYTAKHGVTPEVATARIELQDAAIPAVADLRALLGERWAATWFDAGRDGRFEVGLAPEADDAATRAAVLAILARHGIAHASDLVRVPFTAARVEDAQESVTGQLARLLESGLVTTSADPRTGEVVVNGATSLTPEQRREIRDLRTSRVPVRLNMTSEASLKGREDACSFTSKIFCDRPLRGGTFIASDAGNSCTAGFMATSKSDGLLYLLTAGHCLRNDGGTLWRTRNAGGTLSYIGSRHAYRSAPDNVDAGIIRVASGSVWHTTTGWGRVVVTASSVTTRDELYPIVDEAYPSFGQVICLTGAIQLQNTTDFTRCGAVNDLSYDASYPDGYMRGLRVLDICGTHDGISGGPYYKSNRAYGD